ncbi:MAG: VOC family protein [Sandaracinaceae bacterium]
MTGPVKSPPKGWPRISAAVYYDDAAAAIDWLCRTFGFEVQLKVEGEGGRIEHSELVYGDGLIMVSQTGRQNRLEPVRGASPRSIDGKVTCALLVQVDDVDAHCAHAREMGARIVDAPETHDYGEDHWADRIYRAEDPEGHQWWFSHRVRG